MTSVPPTANGRAVLALIVAAVCIAMPATTRAAAPVPPSSYVFDLGTNVVRVSERAEVVRPIASLTKLVTAMVVLDTHADLERTVAYNPRRHAAYRNWMHFRRGDRLSGRDLLLATLTGSQNITARMLVDLTPYTEAKFVDRMNAKAATLGLAQTRFSDVHGLSPKNVSTASEVARLFTVALGYPDIRNALERSHAIAMIAPRQGRPRVQRFSHTNALLQRRQRFATEASKTGYLDEAGDTIAMLVRDPATNLRFVIVTLGEPRRASRFALAQRLGNAAVGATRIAGWKGT